MKTEELCFRSPWTMTSNDCFGFCAMELRSVSGTYALRLPDVPPPSELPPLRLAPATEAIAKTATAETTAPARRPPRPHNAFERDSPREPRPQRAFERSSLLALCRIYPTSLFLPCSMCRAHRPHLHVKHEERRSDSIE